MWAWKRGGALREEEGGNEERAAAAVSMLLLLEERAAAAAVWYFFVELAQGRVGGRASPPLPWYNKTMSSCHVALIVK